VKRLLEVHRTFLKGVTDTVTQMDVRMASPDVAVATVISNMSVFRSPASNVSSARRGRAASQRLGFGYTPTSHTQGVISMDEHACARVLQSRVARAVASLHETVRVSRLITARSRALRGTLSAPNIARSCGCGSRDVYTTLMMPQATYRRCRSCGDIWVWNRVGEQTESGEQDCPDWVQN
jgi:hypothetical protein